MLKQIRRVIRQAIRAAFCPLVVADSYGTFKPVWSRAEALSWLPACGPTAAVFHRRTGQAIAARMLQPKG